MRLLVSICFTDGDTNVSSKKTQDSRVNNNRGKNKDPQILTLLLLHTLPLQGRVQRQKSVILFAPNKAYVHLEI